MRIIAPMMILIMMTSTLAGCTGGDPDSGGEMDSDAINDLIDQNLQDFINNTTITVNQEIHHHYYNNTTVNEGDSTNNAYNTEYNNTTLIDGGEVNNYDNSVAHINGTDSNLMNGQGDVYLLDIQFNLDDLVPGWDDVDQRNNTFNYSWEYYDYATNQERIDIFEFSCQVFYVVGANSTNSEAQVSFWEDSSQYYNAWSNMYNSTVKELLWNAGYSYSTDSISNQYIEKICNEDYVSSYSGLLYEIPIVEGMALKAYSTPSYTYYQTHYVWTNNCNSIIGHYGDYSWEEQYQPFCGNSSGQLSAFSVSYLFETINWYYGQGGWVGGSSDSTLEVYVSNILPDWDYRIIVYFEMTTSMNNFE
jgi:hypothetical protein